jgi:hypothetical protein
MKLWIFILVFIFFIVVFLNMLIGGYIVVVVGKEKIYYNPKRWIQQKKVHN